MSKYTIDFLTWLKGLFYTETEVDNLLENKLNTSEAQAQVTKFTNKDRVNIDRLLRYMENDGAENFYTLALKATSDEADGIAETNTFTQDDGDKIGLTDADYLVLYAGVYKDGTLQTGRTDSVTFKLTDGTVLGTSNINTGASSVKIPNHIYLDLGLRQEGIYYMYAEATISGSVVKSNIIRVFVKDNNNLYNYNIWSGTEYNNNTEGFDKTSNIQLLSSKDFSNIGETSLKINCTEAFNFIEIQKLNGLTIGKTITISLIIHNPTAQVRCRLKSDNNSNINTITVPTSNNSKKVSVAGVIHSEYSNITLRIFIDGISLTHIDNITSNIS